MKSSPRSHARARPAWKRAMDVVGDTTLRVALSPVMLGVAVAVRHSSPGRAVVPAERVRYLAEIAESLRGYHKLTAEQAAIARERQSLKTAKTIFEGCDKQAADFDKLIAWKDGQLTPTAKKLLAMWPDMKKAYAGD